MDVRTSLLSESAAGGGAAIQFPGRTGRRIKIHCGRKRCGFLKKQATALPYGMPQESVSVPSRRSTATVSSPSPHPLLKISISSRPSIPPPWLKTAERLLCRSLIHRKKPWKECRISRTLCEKKPFLHTGGSFQGIQPPLFVLGPSDFSWGKRESGRFRACPLQKSDR